MFEGGALLHGTMTFVVIFAFKKSNDSDLARHQRYRQRRDVLKMPDFFPPLSHCFSKLCAS